MFDSFTLKLPSTVGEASRELELLGDRARIYAGGTELLIMMRHRLLRPNVLINIKQIQGLNAIVLKDDSVQIGPCVTHYQLETDPIIRKHLPTFAHAEHQVANIRVRAQGTIGGNLCFADPNSDPGTVLLVYDSSVKLQKRDAVRQVPLRMFFSGMYETVREETEVVIQIEVPRLPEGWRSTYLRVHKLQRPTLTTAVAAKLVSGNITDVRLAVGCIGNKPERLKDLEVKLRGAPVDDAKKLIAESGNYINELFQPSDDLLGSRSYKLHITKVLLARGLQELVGMEK